MVTITESTKHVEESVGKQASERKLGEKLSIRQDWLEIDGLYELVKEYLCLFHSSNLTDSAQGSYANNLNNLVYLLFVDKSDLTESQKKVK
ncbi:MAG: hypothetical protein ACR5KX_05925 [Wolbachia sp.]